MITNTSRIDIRISAVIRGKLAEDAGQYGSLSKVARTIIERHYMRTTLGVIPQHRKTGKIR